MKTTVRWALALSLISHGLCALSLSLWLASPLRPTLNRDHTVSSPSTTWIEVQAPLPPLKNAASVRQDSPHKQKSHSHNKMTSSEARPLTQPSTLKGKGESSQNLADAFSSELKRRVAAFLDYPIGLRSRRIQGTPLIQMILLADGALESAKLLQSSGHEDLDLLALDAVQRAAHYPKVPEGLQSERQKKIGRFIVNLPIQFRQP